MESSTFYPGVPEKTKEKTHTKKKKVSSKNINKQNKNKQHSEKQQQTNKQNKKKNTFVVKCTSSASITKHTHIRIQTKPKSNIIKTPLKRNIKQKIILGIVINCYL